MDDDSRIPLAPSRFFRIETDRTRSAVALDGLFAGPQPSACWLIGGGPSLRNLPHPLIHDSPIPRMGVNLSGTGLLRPTFWTAYDPTVRFHRSVYLDPGVLKCLPAGRAFDVVPETTFKVCECPNTVFFERDTQRGFRDLFAATAVGIVDWRDSFVQAIDILYRLGFRVIYLAGCDMWVKPSAAQIAHAASYGVNYEPRERLRDFLQRCERAGLSAEELDELPPGAHYHFAEWKPIRAAANTDEHYFRIVQLLRLSRRSITAAGLQIISVTPHSRLNEHFSYQPVRHVVRRLRRTIGDPQREPVTGLYRGTVARGRRSLCPMQDFPSPGSARPTKKHNTPPPLPLSIPRRPTHDPEILAEYEGFAPIKRNRTIDNDWRRQVDQLRQHTPRLCEDG